MNYNEHIKLEERNKFREKVFSFYFSYQFFMKIPKLFSRKKNKTLFFGISDFSIFFRAYLVGKKFSIFSIQTFRKQGKHV